MDDEKKPQERPPSGWEDPFSVSPGVALAFATIFYLVARFACHQTLDKVVTYVLSGIMVIGLLFDLVINKMAALGMILIANWHYPHIPPSYRSNENKEESKDEK